MIRASRKLRAVAWGSVVWSERPGLESPAVFLLWYAAVESGGGLRLPNLKERPKAKRLKLKSYAAALMSTAGFKLTRLAIKTGPTEP